MIKTKKPKIAAKFFPFAARQPLWEMAKKYGKKKYTIVAIWDYMWWRSGKGGLFELAEDIVCWDLDCDPTTLRAVRKILIAEGWLRKETLRDKGGKWLTRGFTVIAKVATVPKSPGGEEQPPSHEPAVAVPTVEGTSDGGTPHTVLVHELDADASTPELEPTSSGFVVSELVSESKATGFDENQNQTPSSLNLSSEEQTQNQTQPLLPYQSEAAKAIADILYPVGIIGDYNAVMATVNRVAEFAYALDYLKWNRGHKTGGLFIRTVDQLEKAMTTGYGVTDMVAHMETKADKCPVCKAVAQKAEDEKAAKTPCQACGNMGARYDWFDQCKDCFDEANRRDAEEAREARERAKLASDRERNPGTYVNPKNCSRCKGSTYGSPSYEDGKTFCGDCMKLPKYRRHSGEREILSAKGGI